MMIKTLCAIALAGAAGTLCRYGVTLLPWTGKYPCGTLCVNLAGALLAGFCYGFLNARCPEHAKYFPILFVGFFGAFTTFSTFMLDTAKLLDSSGGLAFLNLAVQNVFGLALAAGGMVLGRHLG